MWDLKLLYLPCTQAGLAGPSEPPIGTSPGAATGPVCIGYLHNCQCMGCLTWIENANDGVAYPPALSTTEGVTEMEGLARKNLAENNKKRKFDNSPVRRM